jgi:cytidylate kinase
MYRAVTWVALQEGIDVRDEAAVTQLAQRLEIDVQPPNVDDGRQYTVLADGQDVTWSIREDIVDANVSTVSAYAGVRSSLVTQQRRICTQNPVVMVGRDIGTVVLPDADLKIYLDAKVKERALRRYREIIAREKEADFEDVLASMRRRDEIDSGREISPLVPACDATIIDTTGLTIEEVLDAIDGLIRQKLTGGLW